MSTKHAGESISTMAGSARKRGACLNCRRRKIKCDGHKPICSQCSRSSGAFRDCEYPGEGPTSSQLLDERISELKARINNLEKPSRTHHFTLQNTCHSRGSSPTSIASSPSSPSGSRSRSSSASCSSQASSSSSCSATSFAEPLPEGRQVVLNIVFSNAHRCGFFIDVENFREMFMHPCLMGDHARPASSLLNAFYLWAVYLSPALSITYGLDESTLLRYAQNSISKDLSGTHPFKVVHVMQAEILLSYYFLEHGRVLQGNYHANSALALSLSSGCSDVCIPWASNASASFSPPEWNTSFAPPEGHLYTRAALRPL